MDFLHNNNIGGDNQLAKDDYQFEPAIVIDEKNDGTAKDEIFSKTEIYPSNKPTRRIIKARITHD